MKEKLINKGVRLPLSYWKALLDLSNKEKPSTTQAHHIRKAIYKYLKSKKVI